MMANLQFSKIKPNPAGKDRGQSGQTPASQLAGEWVDIKNISSSPVSMDGLELYHLAYAAGATQGKWDKVTSFTGTLPSGSTVRVHSGSGPDSVIRPEDRAGAEYHAFTRRDYVWNNRQGDSPLLFSPTLKQNIDQASYDPFPPEGQILIRSGSKLVPVGVPAYAR
jgi:hypothetical protein